MQNFMRDSWTSLGSDFVSVLRSDSQSGATVIVVAQDRSIVLVKAQAGHRMPMLTRTPPATAFADHETACREAHALASDLFDQLLASAARRHQHTLSA